MAINIKGPYEVAGPPSAWRRYPYTWQMNRIRENLSGAWEPCVSSLEPAPEYVAEGLTEEYHVVEPVLFLDRPLWVSKRTTYLKGGILYHDYALCPAVGCRIKEIPPPSVRSSYSRTGHIHVPIKNSNSDRINK